MRSCVGRTATVDSVLGALSALEERCIAAAAETPRDARDVPLVCSCFDHIRGNTELDDRFYVLGCAPVAVRPKEYEVGACSDCGCWRGRKPPARCSSSDHDAKYRERMANISMSPPL